MTNSNTWPAAGILNASNCKPGESIPAYGDVSNMKGLVTRLVLQLPFAFVFAFVFVFALHSGVDALPQLLTRLEMRHMFCC